MSFGFVDPWHAFLPREGGHVIAFMGSGGKTTLMQTVAAIYEQAGIETVLTTTTRCEVLPSLPALRWGDLEHEDATALPAHFFVHDGEVEPGKWRGLVAEQVDRLGGLLPERVVLAEVDGAAKHPLKLYRAGEPVWPERTSLAVMVMGVDAVGGPIGQKVHRWGSIDFAPLAGLADHSLLDWDHLADLLLGEGGYLAQLPVTVPAVLALTGLAEQDDSIGLFEFVGRAMNRPEFPLVMFCSLGEAGLAIRTACAERDG